MSLEVRKYKFEEGNSHDIFELELVPEVVDGTEVYNIEAVVSDSTGIVGKSEKLHYGYLSKEMANFLDQRNEFGFANIERLSLKSPIKYPDEIANLSQKIIIDRHPEAGNAIPQISLDPIKYSDRLEPTIRDAKISAQNSLENVVITCQYESIHLDSNGEIKDSQIEFYTEQGASTYGRTIKGSKFANAKMTNIIHDLSLFVDKAGLEYTSLVCDKIQMNNSSSSGSLIKFIASNSSEAEAKTKIPIYLENIKLDSHACLEVNLSNDLSKEANIPVEFKNADFNQYNVFEIDGALSVENSSFKNLRFISSLDNKESVQKIENSICRDVIRLHNISKLSFSEINNTDISNNKEVEVSNEFIKDQRIGNYEDFAKNSQTRANFDRDSRITEDLEVL